MNPMAPTARIPSRQILMESQSSFRAGFLACFSSLPTDWRKVRSPNFVQAQETFVSGIKTYLENVVCVFG